MNMSMIITYKQTPLSISRTQFTFNQYSHVTYSAYVKSEIYICASFKILMDVISLFNYV